MRFGKNVLLVFAEPAMEFKACAANIKKQSRVGACQEKNCVHHAGCEIYRQAHEMESKENA